MGKRRDGVRRVQSAQGLAVTARVRNVSALLSASADNLGVAGQRAGVPAELPARELARLPVLGQRTGELTLKYTSPASRERALPAWQQYSATRWLVALVSPPRTSPAIARATGSHDGSIVARTSHSGCAPGRRPG